MIKTIRDRGKYRSNYTPKHDAFESTKQGLAVTPSDMSNMLSRGIPISAQINEELFFDGLDNPSFDIPIEEQRGVDVNDVWLAQRQARSKLISAHKRDKELYD